MRSMASPNMGATDRYLILLHPAPWVSGMVFSRASSVMLLFFPYTEEAAITVAHAARAFGKEDAVVYRQKI